MDEMEWGTARNDSHNSEPYRAANEAEARAYTEYRNTHYNSGDIIFYTVRRIAAGPWVEHNTINDDSKDERPLSARLDAYIANLQSIAGQSEYIAQVVNIKTGADTQPIIDMANLQRLIADDLTKIVNGEKLTEFRVEGVI